MQPTPPSAVAAAASASTLSWTILTGLLSTVASGAMIFGGVVPFIPQMRVIRRDRSVQGFSTLVCCALLIANILRVLFWFVRHFELPLLAQSAIMIVTMLLMLQVCVEIGGEPQSIPKLSIRLKDDPWSARYFWRWTRFDDYVIFLLCFTAVAAALTFACRASALYVEALGFLAVLTEAVIGLPQFLRNHRLKSTAGMSVIMVGCWLSGDLFKTAYFIVNAAPAQFAVCGALQICLDLAILTQVVLFGGSRDHPAAAAPRSHALVD